MTNVAIIPARGGSKRLPGKNIHVIDGKPLIAYSILAALQSKLFDTVMVSTDSTTIADTAKLFGAVVPFYRSEVNSNDHATTADVLEEVLSHYSEQSISIQNFCCIYPTALFVTAKDLIDSYNQLDEQTSAVVSVAEYSSPIQRSFVVKNNALEYKWQQYRNIRTQDLDKSYYDAGQFYWQRVEIFQQFKTLIPTNTKPYVLESNNVQDIDTLEDLELAEIKYRYKNEKNYTTI